jgi:hypothetical protein
MAEQDDARRADGAKPATAAVPPTGQTSDAATTRSPADRDIFGDDGATRPAKDREHPPDQPSSEAGGVE